MLKIHLVEELRKERERRERQKRTEADESGREETLVRDREDETCKIREVSA